VQLAPERDGTGPGDSDVKHRLRLSEVVGESLVVIPHGTRTHAEAPLARRFGAHGADRHAIPLVMIVYDEQLSDTGPGQPVGYGPRADAVVWHEPHERGSLQTDECRRGRHRQHAGLPEDRRCLQHLRRMEVAQVRERRGILDRAPGVGNRALFAILGEGVEGDELHGRALRGFERELGTTEHFTPGPGRRTGERQAGVDAAHELTNVLNPPPRAP
jgi:hypothetical protein